MKFKKGDIVRPSLKGIVHLAIKPERRGVVGVVSANQQSHSDSVSVQWPWRKTPDRWHESFVELALDVDV